MVPDEPPPPPTDIARSDSSFSSFSVREQRFGGSDAGTSYAALNLDVKQTRRSVPPEMYGTRNDGAHCRPVLRAAPTPRQLGRCPSFKRHFLSPRAKALVARFASNNPESIGLNWLFPSPI